jgi:hypothetical protein
MTDPISFDPFLGWVDTTDPDNLPAEVRIIMASDLLRYENFGVATETAVNELITDMATAINPPWTSIADKPATFTPSAHTHVGDDIALATTALPGALSAADKTKLDGATSTVTVNRLVIRDAEGRAQFMTPEGDYDAATKLYVDANIGAVGADTGWLTVPLQGTWTHSNAFGSTGLKIRVKNGIVFLNGRVDNANAWVQGEVICSDLPAINAAITAPSNRAVGVACTVNTEGYAITVAAGGPNASLLLNCTWPTG